MKKKKSSNDTNDTNTSDTGIFVSFDSFDDIKTLQPDFDAKTFVPFVIFVVPLHKHKQN